MKPLSKRSEDQKGKVTAASPFYEIIQDAYRVFKQGPTEHAVCECCMYPKIRKDFFNHKQQDLPLHYIQDWFFAAADSPMKKSAWQFVLPRILEVLASGEEPSYIGLEVSLNRFQTGDPSNWSSQQWHVLDQFQKLFLSTENPSTDVYLDDILCMFAIAGWSTEELFAQILQWPTAQLVDRLWKEWCNFPNPDIWITAFWVDANISRDFYLWSDLLDKITNFALDDSTTPDLAEKAMAVSDLISSTSGYDQV